MNFYRKSNEEKTIEVLVPQRTKNPLDIILDKFLVRLTVTEPILLCESLLKIRRFLINLLFMKKKDAKRFLYFSSVFVFLFLLKNNHFLEAKFFAFNFCSKIFGDSVKYSLFKIILTNSYMLDQESIFKLLKTRFFPFLKNQQVFREFLDFYNQGDLSHIYKNFKAIVFLSKKLKKKISPIHRLRKASSSSQKYQSVLYRKKKRSDRNTVCLSDSKHLKFLEILEIRSKFSEQINCIDISPDRKMLILGNQNGLINVYKVTNMVPKKRKIDLRGHEYSVTCAKKVNFGNYVLSGSYGGELYLWTLKRKSLVLKYQTLSHSIWDLSITPDGKKFCSTGSQGFAGLWCLERPFPYRFLNGHKLDVNIAKWHPNTNFLATGSDDRSIRLWDVRVNKSVGKIMFNGNVNGLDFSPCGRRLTVSGKSKYISTFDMRTLTVLFKIKEKYMENKVDKISYYNNESFGYIKDHKIVKLWNFGKKRNPQNILPLKFATRLDKIFLLEIKKFNKITIAGIKNN